MHIRVLEEQNVVCRDKAIQSEAKGTCENELVKQPYTWNKRQKLLESQKPKSLGLETLMPMQHVIIKKQCFKVFFPSVVQGKRMVLISHVWEEHDVFYNYCGDGLRLGEAFLLSLWSFSMFCKKFCEFFQL